MSNSPNLMIALGGYVIQFRSVLLSIFIFVMSLQVRAQSTSASVPDTEIKTDLTTIKDESVQRKLTFEFESWNWSNIRGTNENTADATSLTSFKFIYAVTPSSSFQLVPMARNSWGVKKDGTGEFTMLDPYVQYAHNDIAEFPGELKVEGNLRLYAGTSEESRNQGQSAMVRGSLTIKRDLKKGLSLSYNALPYGFVTSQDTYVDKEEVEQPNLNFRFWHYLELAGDISSKWSFYSDLGIDTHYFRNTKEEVSNQPKEYLYAETGIAYAFNEVFKVTGGVSSYWDRDLRAQENQFALYRDDETSYMLVTNVYF